MSGVLAVIPARFASSRFPGKPLAPILGIPLVLRVHARVARAIPPGQVLVATDDDRIRACCESAGVRVAMTPADCLTGTDRVWHAARETDASVILNVQGDEPLVEPEDILAVLSDWQRHGEGVTNAMCALACDGDVSSPHVPKVVAREDGRLAYISRSPVPFHGRAARPAAYRRQVCIYAFGPRELRAFATLGRRSALECAEDVEILRCLDLGIDVRMVEVRGASHAVDVPEDVARIEEALLAQGPP